jgi:hypothetical protein
MSNSEAQSDGDGDATGMPSVFRPGGVSYLQLPTNDPRASADFYVAVFGWHLNGNPEHPNFADASGHVIGAWVTTRPVARDAGVVPYVYVEDITATIERALGAGGTLVQEPYPEGTLSVGMIRDPAGNVVGVWQETAR